jgi:carbonic anhydrase/acetyltransferase-like protein (isoleucine patch superfamily)
MYTSLIYHLVRIDKLTAHPTALISQDTVLQGDITIGPGCVIHPRASILAINGPIEIGDNCIIEELAMLVNRLVGLKRSRLSVDLD